MLEHLFGSKTRLKLLRTFFRDAEKSYYVRELTRLLEVQINAIRRELELLLAAGLILEVEMKEAVKEKVGMNLRKYYRLNPDSILYPELQALLLKAQILGEQQFTEEIRGKAGEVALFVMTGRFVNAKDVQSDLLLVGSIRENALERIIKKYEKELGFEIRYTTMTEKEFRDRRQMMDKFVYSLFEADHVKVVNTLGI